MIQRSVLSSPSVFQFLPAHGSVSVRRIGGLVALISCLASGAPLMADVHSESHTTEPANPPEATVRVVQTAHGSADLLDAAQKRWSEGKKDEAELIFAELLSQPVPIEEKRDALLEMANLFGETDASRAIIILEKFLQTYPRDSASSSILLKLGVLYRSQGAYEIASARFFRVLNATMRDGNEDLQAARQRATQARFELAEMLTEQGRLTEAAAVYRKIELLDLSPEDRMTVRFRLSCVAFETRDYKAAVESFAALREEEPSGPYQLESAYYLAAGLKALGQEREAFDVVVGLLSSQISDVSGDQAQSIYWKRRTGNELANGFYKQGEYLSALTIYQALARLSDDTEWRWPAVYQIGLCFEHLELPQRALEAYDAILKGMPVTDADLVRADASLRDLARWRSDHVKWMLDYGERFQIMVGSDTSDS